MPKKKKVKLNELTKSGWIVTAGKKGEKKKGKSGTKGRKAFNGIIADSKEMDRLLAEL